ncbi:putative RNA recognition motif domain, nucleotide-binding alpha-beta plait domain superfamily [Helianthus annuus]|nr:putative RNA recognition motif domain, nucleotide-binding alpha-beta plait domain superfamily [Helianthus annuus]KAJ0466878.1 putative RNA recognition motif domain, nucleotide-binding alpha-beta plait domain superfamily [Helianthus annuus]
MAGTFNHMPCSSTSPSPSSVTVARSGGLSTPSFSCRTPINHHRPYSTSSSRLSISSSSKKNRLQILACSSPSQPQKTATNFTSSTKLYVSGLSFRTSEESLQNAFQSFGQLIEVNLVMDKIANRPRGFAFLRYATKEESEKAIEGMHGKFLDGRVIFVEYAKPRSQLNQGVKQDSKPYR